MSERQRIINLGLPKSGTTTLAHALRVSGLRIADFRIRKRQTPDTALHGAFVGQLLYQNYFETGDPLHGLDRFDGFSEVSTLRAGVSFWPQMDFGLIEAIREHHPGAVFLATWRQPERLSNSMLRWSNLGTERLPEGQVPGLPAPFGDRPEHRMQWICAHYAHLERIFAGDPRFLMLDVGARNAARTLGQFLDRKIPWWGKANRNRPKQQQTEAN
jgi:hypothetical protein